MGNKDYILLNASATRQARREFIQFPKRLYKESDYYVPLFDTDVRKLLLKRHPFFLHSQGDFFLLLKNGETVARCLITENTRYNNFHGTTFAFFDFFDLIDDQETAEVLFGHLAAWARKRGLSSLVGPMLSGGAAGAGILVQGFEHTPAMTMMRYNYPYYQTILEAAGFTKYVDLHSFSVPPEHFIIPDRIRKLAEHVLQRGRFTALRFKNKGEIKKYIGDIKDLYGKTLNHHLEDYPLSRQELDQVENELLTILDPDLISLLAYDGKVIGYVLGFADISRTLHLNRGLLGPLQILRILLTLKKSEKILFNGIGILPEYQRLGGNALLYQELESMMMKRKFREAEMVQISEKTELMISDAGSLGAKPYKVHRMYKLDL
ncbi:MAG: hypothetical protein JW760_05160 [Spirochaetales bacterium]|nr:hypothetical protein [Spirochaetales bacterium]